MLSTIISIMPPWPWWRHQVEAFSELLALCAGNSPVTGEFPHKGQWHRAWIFSVISTSTNGWASNREAGDLTRHRAHYNVTAMLGTLSHYWQFATGTTGHQWIPLIKDQLCRALMFFLVNSQKMLNKQSSCPWLKTPLVERPVIWDAKRPCNFNGLVCNWSTRVTHNPTNKYHAAFNNAF